MTGPTDHTQPKNIAALLYLFSMTILMSKFKMFHKHLPEMNDDRILQEVVGSISIPVVSDSTNLSHQLYL